MSDDVEEVWPMLRSLKAREDMCGKEWKREAFRRKKVEKLDRWEEVHSCLSIWRLLLNRCRLDWQVGESRPRLKREKRELEKKSKRV